MPRFDRASGKLEKMPTRPEAEGREGISSPDATGRTKVNKTEGYGQQWSGPYWLQDVEKESAPAWWTAPERTYTGDEHWSGEEKYWQEGR